MAIPWSLDARVLVRPAREFRTLLPVGPRSSTWVAIRRPLFVSFALASAVSLIATSVASVRFIPSAGLYWSFVPAAEILGLFAVTRRRGSPPFRSLVDVFFAGHAAWTLMILSISVLLASAAPTQWLAIIVGPFVVGIVLAAVWSLYIDACFFRYICGAALSRAVLDVAIHRLITWSLVFWIFAVPTATPFGVYHGIARDIAELMR